MTKKVLTLALLSSLVTACEQVDSSAVRTEGLHADFKATADGSGETELHATLRVGGGGSNTFLDLVDGDRLLAMNGADEEEMERTSSVFGMIVYRARFATDRENARFRVAFEREPHDQEEANCRGGSALDSVATLPPPFEILAPTPDARFSRSDDDLVIRWLGSNGDDDFHASISGACFSDDGLDVDDEDGTFRLRAGKLKSIGDSPQSCRATLTMVRSRKGRVDSAYGEGGDFMAEQTRSVSFWSEP